MATLDIGETASFRPRRQDERDAGPVADKEWREPANSGRGAPRLSRSYRFGVPPCRIYRPSPSPLQWARSPARWRLGFEHGSPPYTELELSIPSLDAAVSYAERRGLRYIVTDPPVRRLTQPVLHIEPQNGDVLWLT
jgi:hypothetical protein